MSSPLTRITLITETFAPEINGVANTLGHLVRGLLARGVAVQVIRPRQHKQDLGQKDNQQEPGLTTVTLPGLPIPGYNELKFGLPLKQTIRRALDEFQPQAIYVATEGPMGWAAVKAAKQLGLPVLSGFHTNFHQYIEHYHLGWLEKLAYGYLRHFHNQTAGTLVPTNVQCDELQSHGFDHVRVLARGVDSQLFHPQKRSAVLRKQWGVKDDDLVLLYVGRIAGEKNMELALATYQQLLHSDERVRLVLVGDGPELPRIREHYPEVICCGMQRGEELATHYASGDVFLFPSKTDTFGNVVTEAMASGLAVVSFDYAAGHEHIQSGQNGMLAPFAHDASFINCAITLLDSPNLLKKLREQARKTALTISWSSIVEEFQCRLQGAQTKDTSYDGNKTAGRKNRATVS
ncbi:glycosyltransferase family 4 protein [Bacterioplanoides sp.]|uniref:glycosyltransferase family 4 protein n=1 Tax=Bacterioplanoides sp. TaxID=2066072 RepID=UPI003B00F4B6